MDSSDDIYSKILESITRESEDHNPMIAPYGTIVHPRLQQQGNDYTTLPSDTTRTQSLNLPRSDLSSWQNDNPQGSNTSATSANPEYRQASDVPTLPQNQHAAVDLFAPNYDLYSIGHALQVGNRIPSSVLEEAALSSPPEQESNSPRTDPHTAGINEQGLHQSQSTLDTTLKEMNPWISNYTSLFDSSAVTINREAGSETCRQLDELKRAVQSRFGPEIQGEEPNVQMATRTSCVASTGAIKHYRCPYPKCYKTVFDRPGSFQRHIESLHHPKFRYTCPFTCCDKVEARRDKMVLHCRYRHLKTLSKAQVDKHKISLPPPPQCTFCTRTVIGWPEFYKCWMSHCDVKLGFSLQDAPTPRGGDEGNGGAGAGGTGASPGNDSLFTGGGPGAMPQGQGNQSHGAYNHGHGASQNTQGFNQTMMSPFPTDLSQFSPEIPRRMHPQGDTQPGTPHTQDRGPNFRGTTQHIPRGQQPPQPRAQQADGDSLRQEQFQCYLCEHSFRSCNFCMFYQTSTYGCHDCPQAVMSRSLEDRIRLARRLITARSNQRALNTTPQEAQEPRDNRTTPQFLSPYDCDLYPVQEQYYNQQGGGGGSQNASGGSRFNSYPRVAILTGVTEPHLNEDEIDPYNMKTMKGQTFAATSIGLPIGIPLPKGMLTSLPSLKSLKSCVKSSTTTDLPLSSDNLKSSMCGPTPAMENTNHMGQARMELVPGKVLYVGMKMLHEERGGHPLRTTVRVLVKLFKLRSSVARAGSKRKTKEDAGAIEKALCMSFKSLNIGSESVKTTEDQDESLTDIESVADGTFSDAGSEVSVASEASISDLRLLACRKPKFYTPSKLSDSGFFDEENDRDNNDTDEHPLMDSASGDSAYESDTESDDEVEDLTPQELFDKWCIEPEPCDEIEGTELEIAMEFELNTLSPWRDALEDPEDDGKITDPTRVFEYFFKYILYVIFTLSRSRNHSSYSKFLE